LRLERRRPTSSRFVFDAGPDGRGCGNRRVRQRRLGLLTRIVARRSIPVPYPRAAGAPCPIVMSSPAVRFRDGFESTHG
jgi:hypothetical protein